MINRVDASLPKSLGDLELKQNDIQRSKHKPGAPPDAADEAAEREEPQSLAPVHIRYLGKNLDIVA